MPPIVTSAEIGRPAPVITGPAAAASLAEEDPRTTSPSAGT